jgi:hypothetical protein
MSPTTTLMPERTVALPHRGEAAAGLPGGATLDARWEQRVRQLAAFKAEHGHCNVPQSYLADRSLAVWVSNVRYRYRQGKLEAQRVCCLEEIGFSWSIRTRRFRRRDWDAMVAALAEFQGRYGHCNVPHRWSKDPELAAWLHGVRCRKGSGRLEPGRIAQLDQLGIVWEPERNRWEQMCAALADYKQCSGDCNVPGTWPENRRLAQWVTAVRASRRRNTLAAERIGQLDAMGFEWDRGGQQRWEAMYEQLACFHQAHGHCRVSTTSAQHHKLGNWVRTQRTRFRQGELSQDEVRRLNDLGFTWELWRQQWEAMFAALVEYQDTYGHCDVPQQFAENRKLGNWVITQRMYYRKGKLDAEQIERLNLLGFHWSLGPERRLVVGPAVLPREKVAPARPDTGRRRAA